MNKFKVGDLVLFDPYYFKISPQRIIEIGIIVNFETKTYLQITLFSPKFEYFFARGPEGLIKIA